MAQLWLLATEHTFKPAGAVVLHLICQRHTPSLVLAGTELVHALSPTRTHARVRQFIGMSQTGKNYKVHLESSKERISISFENHNTILFWWLLQEMWLLFLDPGPWSRRRRVSGRAVWSFMLSCVGGLHRGGIVGARDGRLCVAGVRERGNQGSRGGGLEGWQDDRSELAHCPTGLD